VVDCGVNNIQLVSETIGLTNIIFENIADYQSALRQTEGIDVIIHLAADAGVPKSLLQPRHNFLVNAQGTLNYLDAARINNVKKFIFASSNAVVGETSTAISETNPLSPKSPYAASKATGEMYCHAYRQSYGLDTCCLRFSNVYGPYSEHKKTVVTNFVRQAFSRRPLIIYGNGKQTRDFIYVDDLVEAIKLAVSSKPQKNNGVFQIATGTETSINDLVSMFKKIFETLAIKKESARKGDVLKNYSSITKASAILKFNAQIKLYDGLKKTIDWYKEQWTET
jgi:UDP-glucose 4-epimerase